MPAAELSSAQLAGRELRSEDHSLVSRELPRGAANLPYFLARDHDALHVRTPVDHHGALVVFGERQRGLERRLHRTASAQRAAAVVDPRLKAELERVADMTLIRERAARAHVRDELEHRLAVAVLQILPAKSMAVEMQQQRALGRRDDRDRVRGVCSARQKWRAAAPVGFRSCPSATHTPMSLAATIRPPLNFSPRRAGR